MQWIWIFVGLMLLMLAALISWFLHHRSTAAFCRIPMPGRLLSLLQRTARLSVQTQDVRALQENALRLMEQIHRLHRTIFASPTLPAAPDGEPRLMALARDAADADHFTLDALSAAITTWDHPATPMEVSALPACIGAAQCQRLALVLQTILADAKNRIRAEKLAPQLLRSKKPYAMLEKAGLNSIGLAALAKALRQQEQPEGIVLLDRWLTVHDITTEVLAQQDDQRQLQLAEEIRCIEACFDSLERLSWTEHCEQADPLHPLLLKDPSDIYPAMDAASRLQLRCQTEHFSRHTHIATDEIVRHALLLCEDAEPRALERYVGYWLQDAEGCRTLHRSLPTKKGRMYARFAMRRGTVRYLLLWVFGVFAGFCFLHSGQPVFMLPFFALVTGDVIRLAVNHLNNPSLPRLSPESIPAHVRTLVVLPALLHDHHEAIRMVRKLSIASHAFPQENVEYLLLGDFPPTMTAVSSLDAGVIHAAASSVAALADKLPLHYLQRGRTWDGERHTYCAHGGRSGAVTELCRLIAQGECADVIAYSTLEPASLERRFDYVFVLSDHQPFVPGMLPTLLQTMTHPLCSRYPTGQGWRGYAVFSTGESPVYQGVGLLQPDAYLEATDGLVNPAMDADALFGELAGHTGIPCGLPPSKDSAPSWDSLLLEAHQAWQMLPWQLPWVKTPSGVINNPLPQPGRFRLREELRRTLLPLGQFVLLLWAVLTQNWLLLLFALAAPELRHFVPRRTWLLQAVCRLSLLPSRMLLPLLPLWDLLRRKRSTSPMTPAVEIWAQGMSATLFAALGILLPAFAVPALLLSAGFACFPLAHRVLEAPVTSEESLTRDHYLLLEDIAGATWRFFCAHTDAALHFPPAFVQFEPGQMTAPYTTPEAIGACLLSCICAKDLGYVSADVAASRIRQSISSLRELPLPFGLPCQQYALPSLTVTDARVDAAAVGFLAAALMTTAQALRTWLPELPPAFAGLSAETEACLTAMDLSALYDKQSGLFHAGLDEHGQPSGNIRCLADDGMLLVVAACARKLVPADCLQQLSRTRAHVHKHEVLLSQHGSAAEQLLSGLFLPQEESAAGAFIHAMMRRGQDGLFGQGPCSVWRFDAHLRYQHATFGLPEAALQPTDSSPVFAPYAAALALPMMPRSAADALSRFCDLGLKGPEGLCDAVDFTNGVSLVGLHDAFHQGILLASAAHCLADSPVQRYFCALPEVEACLPLLSATAPAFTLPELSFSRSMRTAEDIPDHPVDVWQKPVPMQLFGNDEFRLLSDAHGGDFMMDGDVPLNASLHFYLVDEGRVYRLGDPRLQGETHFARGETRHEQLCGSLRSELISCADTLRRRALHILTITNLSTRDRLIELADFLLPALDANPVTLEPTSPEPGHLTIHARGTERTLHHTVNATITPLLDTVCTDADVFLGRGGTFHRPASLEKPMRDSLTPSIKPCMSFRGRYALGGRGQITLWFTTSLTDAEPPALPELAGIRQLAAMQDSAIDSSAALSWTQLQSAQMLIAPLRQTGWQLSFLADDPSTIVLMDLLSILGWLNLHGQPAKLRIHCPPDMKETIAEHLHASLSEDQASFALPDESPLPLVFTASQPLSEQLGALYTHMTLPDSAQKTPVPAKLPQLTLIHTGPYGGFDLETLDYVLQLEPGQHPPEPWRNIHSTRYFQEQTDDCGLRAPLYEQVWIRMADGTILSPWSLEMPRAIRMRPGETDWEAWSDQLDLRLRVACLPGHRCGIRTLHIHNATETPLTLRIAVIARMTDAPLISTDGLIMTDRTDQRLQSFLAGDGWQTRRVCASWAASVTDAPCLDLPDTPNGDSALLTCEIMLEPHRSGKVVWLAGFARHGEDVARALDTLHTHSTSDLFRSVQSARTHQLSCLTVSTPEATLDLLLNRILPLQALNASGVTGMPALTYLASQEARRALLRQARQPMTRDEWAHFILHLADYVRITGDDGLLHVRLPARDESLLACCHDALLTVPLDHQHLPQGADQPRRCFLYALAAHALDKISPDPDALEFSRRLLNAADTYLWQDGYYGSSLRLDVQTLACAAYGANPRTRQAISACWTTLYDEQHGLIRLNDATDTPTLPGLPENGGMVTLEAVRYLRALLKTARHAEAFELMRALNPLHHTDTPERQAIFRCAPYQLHGGMCAAPMQAGQAVPGGEDAAALLYAIILEDILGIQRHGDVLRLNPCVPPDWEDFTVHLRVGASTWHISAERRIRTLTLDGETVTSGEIRLTDDGKVHQVRFPLK